MSVRLIVRHVAVKALSVYRCNVCQTETTGDTVRREINDPPSDVNLANVCLPVSNTHMPLGWCSNGLNAHICPVCQRDLA